MERNYDEVVSEMLIQLDQIERRMYKADRRLDLSIKRLVKAETRMEEFDRKLEQSIKDQKAQSQLQAKANAHFLKQLTQQAKLMDNLIRKNGLKL